MKDRMSNRWMGTSAMGTPPFAAIALAIVSLFIAAQAFAGPSLSSHAGLIAGNAAPLAQNDTADKPKTNASNSPDGDALARAIASVVKIKTRASPGARSLQTLGAEREGSAIVVGRDNLLLTIGYLIVEAETVEVENGDGRFVPATVVAYDHASGFGLVRALTPLGLPPIELGSSDRMSESDSAIFAAAGGVDAASTAVLVSKRRFAGYWEYMIDDALFTSPPRFDHSGAALIDRNGKLVGVGSLIVADVLPPTERQKMPGNMFVPIDLLKSIMAELLATGTSAKAHRPWIGVTSHELEGRVFVQRVQRDSPAEAAGLRQGDILLSVGSEKISKLEDFYSELWKNRKAGDDVPLTVLQGTEVRKITVKSIDRAQYVRPKSSI